MRLRLGLALMMTMAVALCAAETTYTVKRGDSLYSIGRAFGVSPAELAERNGISRNAYVYAGQKLTIPGKSSGAAPSSGKALNLTLPRNVRRAIENAKVRPGRWRYIVIHHSGVNTGTMKSMDRYHREVRRMENGLAYHFVIGNGNGMRDGEIGVGNRWVKQLQGGHLASEAQDQVALGICLVGNFDKARPTRKQLQSLELLVDALMQRCKLTPEAVKSHRQINVVETRCPGANFSINAFREQLKR